MQSIYAESFDQKSSEKAVDTSQHATSHPFLAAWVITTRNMGKEGVWAAVISAGCISWKFPHTTSLAFFLCAPFYLLIVGVSNLFLYS